MTRITANRESVLMRSSVSESAALWLGPSPSPAVNGKITIGTSPGGVASGLSFAPLDVAIRDSVAVLWPTNMNPTADVLITAATTIEVAMPNGQRAVRA